MTPSVRKYHIKWRPSEDSVNLDVSQKVEEAYITIPSVQDPSDPYLSFAFPPTLAVGAVYKVNVYSVVEISTPTAPGTLTMESKELHEKIFVKSQNELLIYVEEQKEQAQ